MNKYLADTTVLVEHLRGNLRAKQFLEKHNPSISTVTVAELIQGSRDKRELSSALKICTSLPDITIDKKISHRALELLEKFYLSHGLLFLDSLIAASAIENNIVLVTANVKHFRFINELQVSLQEEIFG